MKEEILKKLISIFSKKYPEPRTALNFSTPFELLIATILSAQSTDKQVNKVTKDLFKKYNRPEDFANMKKEKLEKEINSIGLYRNKSKYIIETSKKIIEDFGGKVPETRKELLGLSGVGRKTANVILASAFSKNAFPVDTHVFRVAKRIGLAKSNRVEEVEKELMENIPENMWIDMHHWLIFHGRETCKAQNPDCSNCDINDYCHFYKK